jgi:hypothetical protein
VAAETLLSLSITVARKLGDLTDADWQALGNWLRHHTAAGLVAFERGGQYGHGHAQGVVKVYATSPQAVNRSIKQALGWTGQGDTSVCTKKLTGKCLHTYTGMLGYCLKDERALHFKMLRHNVTDAELDEGRDLYLKFGAGNLKKRTQLTPTNLFTKAMVFYSLHSRDDRNAVTIQQIILEMIQSGKYFPSATWVIPFQGRGMSHPRAQALWRMYKAPMSVTVEDVHL